MQTSPKRSAVVLSCLQVVLWFLKPCPPVVFSLPNRTLAPGTETAEFGVFLGKQPGAELKPLLQGHGGGAVGQGCPEGQGMRPTLQLSEHSERASVPVGRFGIFRP